jgi:hypothetical protein
VRINDGACDLDSSILCGCRYRLRPDRLAYQQEPYNEALEQAIADASA